MKGIRSALGWVAAAALGLVMSAGSDSVRAGTVYQSVNENLNPGLFFWAAPSGNIGWYWTPATDLDLLGVQTRLNTVGNNIFNNYTFTTTLYTDRPAVGGTPLGAFMWNGATPIDGPWLGGEFAAPLSLTGGTTYFLGMAGWEQSLAEHPGGGSGVNWIHPPDQDGAENLGAGSGYTGVGFSAQMNTGMMPANVDSPVLRFIIPEPSTLAILGLGAVLVLRRRAGA